MKDDHSKRRIRNARVKVHRDGSLSIRDAVAYLPPEELRERVERALRDREGESSPTK